VEDVVKPAALPDLDFWRGRRILLTGHSGFKGAWAALWLARLGAEVHGFALPPEGSDSLWRDLPDGLLAAETIGDLRDRESVAEAVSRARPQLVLHLAAQSLVRRGYADPVGTFATNVLGTVHLLEALRGSEELEAVLVVTSDKVYAPGEVQQPFRERDPLGGVDPYSASKAAAELAARSFACSNFQEAGVAVATARAGNVIGGGDFGEDRLVPDLWRASRSGAKLRLRAPAATRPWQHVLDPLAGYLLYVEALARGTNLPRALNFGPAPGPTLSVAALAEALGSGGYEADPGPHPTEAETLSLDSSLAMASLGWRPRLGPTDMIAWTADWYADFAAGAPAAALCEAQICAYEALA
jgi:CDP-glucose 4,6-dehydratase